MIWLGHRQFDKNGVFYYIYRHKLREFRSVDNLKKSPRLPGNLEELSIARYTFTLEARETLNLPPYKGSTLRGGFGSVFRKVICINRAKDCSDCLLKYKCIYSFVFESRPALDSSHLSKYRSIPRPFVIEPPAEEKQLYRPKEVGK